MDLTPGRLVEEAEKCVGEGGERKQAGFDPESGHLSAFPLTGAAAAFVDVWLGLNHIERTTHSLERTPPPHSRVRCGWFPTLSPLLVDQFGSTFPEAIALWSQHIWYTLLSTPYDIVIKDINNLKRASKIITNALIHRANDGLCVHDAKSLSQA